MCIWHNQHFSDVWKIIISFKRLSFSTLMVGGVDCAHTFFRPLFFHEKSDVGFSNFVTFPNLLWMNFEKLKKNVLHSNFVLFRRSTPHTSNIQKAPLLGITNWFFPIWFFVLFWNDGDGNDNCYTFHFFLFMLPIKNEWAILRIFIWNLV